MDKVLLQWHVSVWQPVERGTCNIPFDLESTPLQIKTDSAAGSGAQMVVRLYDEQKSHTSSLVIQFISPMKYRVNHCVTSYTVLPTQPPDDVDKIWTFTKTSTAFIISCNGVELLNYVFSDSSRSKCVPTWSRDVEKIDFHRNDSASDFYRAHATAGKEMISSARLHGDLMIDK